MKDKFEIKNFIAEIGVNHENDINKAKLMIDECSDVGVGAVKFQSYSAKKLAAKYSPAYWDTSKFKDLGEMNKKESKRLDLGIKFLRLIGIKVERFDNDINIYGNPNLELSKKFEVKNFLKDHRIFFLSCIAALTLGGKWTIHDKGSANTSFPKFLETLKFLGAKIN